VRTAQTHLRSALFCTPSTGRTRIAENSARIWSSLNGPFDIAKQNPQRSSYELRLFKPGKLGKSF